MGHEAAPITPVLDTSTDLLQKLLASLPDDKNKAGSEQRSQVCDCLENIGKQMDEARSIWQSYAENPVQKDDQYTAVMWIGPQRSRELLRVHLRLRDLARKLSEAGGIAFHDTIGISTQVDIVDAYSQLLPDETGASRAADAIETIENRHADIRDAIARLN